MNQEEVDKCTILRCLVGSQAYGLGGADSNRDEKGVCIEPYEEALTLKGEFEQFEYRTATARTGEKDAKSEAGDLDLTIYSLRKFLRLACKGNPTIMEMLFIKDKNLLVRVDARGLQLQEMFPFLVSRDAGSSYLGFMQAQRKRMISEQGGLKVQRPDLVDKHGYDVKFASHMVRLGFQGVELLTTGELILPMVGEPLEKTKAIKDGKWSMHETLTLAGELEREVKDLISNGPIRDHADVPTIEDWMRQVYFENWKATTKYKYFHATRKSLFGDDEPEVVH